MTQRTSGTGKAVIERRGASHYASDVLGKATVRKQIERTAKIRTAPEPNTPAPKHSSGG